MKTDYRRNPWTLDVIFIQEDQLLKSLVLEFGLKKWSVIAEKVSGPSVFFRTGKQCRERWYNHLDPSIKTEEWDSSEEETIFKYTKVYGNQWSKIAKILPGRTENAIKNYFYSTVRKNLRRINKKLILKEKIQGPIKELKKNQKLNELIFCDPKKSQMAAQKINEAANLKTETDSVIKLEPENKIELNQFYTELAKTAGYQWRFGDDLYQANEIMSNLLSQQQYFQYCIQSYLNTLTFSS
jgi:transcriptional activator Myb